MFVYEGTLLLFYFFMVAHNDKLATVWKWLFAIYLKVRITKFELLTAETFLSISPLSLAIITLFYVIFSTSAPAVPLKTIRLMLFI